MVLSVWNNGWLIKFFHFKNINYGNNNDWCIPVCALPHDLQRNQEMSLYAQIYKNKIK